MFHAADEPRDLLLIFLVAESAHVFAFGERPWGFPSLIRGLK